MNHAEILRINKEVGKEYGTVLPIKITGDPAPNFNWNSVNIPSNLEKTQNERIIKNTLRHEYGHLFINPRDLVVGETMLHIAKSMDLPEPMDAVNVVSDLLVDSTLMRIHGKEYLEFLEFYLARTKVPILQVMAAFYAEHAEHLGLKTKLNKLPAGTKLHKILLNGHVDFYTRVYRAYELLRDYFPIKHIKIPHGVSVLVITNVNKNRVTKELEKNGFRPEILEKIELGPLMSIPGTETMFYVSTNPKQIAEVRMQLELELPEENSGKTFGTQYGTWSAGDPPEKLDTVKTIENAGVIVPDITTISQEDASRGEFGVNTVGIVLDCSGSMGGAKFMAAQIATINILRKFKHTGVKIGFIPFSGGIKERYIIYPTSNYDAIEELLIRIMPSGGTVLEPALSAASAMGLDLLYIFTDSHTSDSRATGKSIKSIRKVVYIINEKDEKIEKWVDGLDKYYVISPEELVVKTKEEVI